MPALQIDQGEQHRPARPEAWLMASLKARLRTRIQAIEGRWGPAAPGPAEGPPAEPSPGDLPGLLRRGVLHEWFGVAGAGTMLERGRLVAARRPRPGTRAGHPEPPWVPPMGVLLELSRKALEASEGFAVWIGSHCWPYLVPRADGGDDDGLLRRSIFIDPPDEASRLWAIDLASRTQAVAALVADGRGLEMASSRRLQLAAESGSALVLLARPPHELSRLSVAATRWLVRCVPSEDRTPRWTVELLRCKGVQPMEALRPPGGSLSRAGSDPVRPGRRWTVEWKRAQSGVHLPAVLRDGSRAAPPQLARLRSA